MLFTALLCQVLLATRLALAIPSSSDRLAARIARRNTASTHQSRPIQPIHAPSIHEANEIDGLTNVTHAAKGSCTSNWASEKKQPTYKTITGTFVVPTPKLPSGANPNAWHSATAWVGIDGRSCGDTILQTGLDFSILGGVVSYNACYEWHPDHARNFENISFGTGDHVTVSVTAASKTSGMATITNKSTKKTVSHTFSGRPPLCHWEKAEWIVEDMTGGDGKLVPFVNFGTVEFIEATAHTVDGKTATPPSAGLVDLVANGKVITKVSTGPHSVTVSYVG